MKNPILAAIPALVLVGIASAQNSMDSVPADSGYTVAAKSPHSRTWRRVTLDTDPVTGDVVTKTNSYTELKTGMHRFVAGQFVEASDQLSVTQTGAEATNSQCQIRFLGNINAPQAVQLTLPGGGTNRLVSNVLGLSYYSPSTGKSVMWAEIRDSYGQILPGGNRALFPDAFLGTHADVLYVQTVSSFEQLILLREQPPSPTEWGIDEADCYLQVITDFTGSVSPQVAREQIGADTDSIVDFGTMAFGRGAAFALDSEANKITVSKEWLLLDQRTCLVEQVRFLDVKPDLASLPPAAPGTASLRNSPTSPLRRLAEHRLLPERKVARKETPAFEVAKSEPEGKGFAMDYIALISQTNMVFQADSTYYVAANSTVQLSGSNVWEGGTVIKFGTNSSISLTPTYSTPTANFYGSEYRPITCTAKDDNAIGDAVTGSTGSPSGYYANPALAFSGLGTTVTPAFLRVAYAKQGIAFPTTDGTISHAQFVNCETAVVAGRSTLAMRNILFLNTATDVFSNGRLSASAENATFSGSACLLGSPTNAVSSSLNLTNCIFINVSNLTSGPVSVSGDYNGFYSTTTFGSDIAPTPSSFPLQTVACGAAYLAPDSPWRGAGTTNINADLRTALRGKTTYPPLVISNTVVASATTLGPQAGRDNKNSTVDLGYHYFPLDYAFYSVTISNCVLTLNPGTAAALLKGLSAAGIFVRSNGQFVSNGGPLSPNWLVAYNMVQEQPGAGVVGMSDGLVSDVVWGAGAGAGSFNCRFTDWSVAAQDTLHITTWHVPVVLQDCEFHGGFIDLEHTFNITNCLMDRVYTYLYQDVSNQVALCNCLLRGGTFEELGLQTNSLFRDNFFEYSANILDDPGWTYTGGHNAFITNYLGQMNKLSSDLVLSNDIAWQTGPLGNFYQPTNSPLINAGTTNADKVALFHYTVTTNFVTGFEVKETNSVVDIGFHYVAVDTNGVPIDTNGDGLPDYLSDSNGNGLIDSGEVAWNVVGDLGLKVLITRPRNGGGPLP